VLIQGILYLCIVESIRRPPPGSNLAWPINDGTYNEQIDRKLEQATVEDNLKLPSRESHLVKDLPYLNTKIPDHYAGHIPTTASERKLFYWLFEPPSYDENTPLIIWLNGGPGCSSMDGLFIESGPLRLVHNTTHWNIKINPHSWNNLPAFLLFVDQPVGTGLSFTRKKIYCKTDNMINIDFYHFLQNFIKVHSDVFLDKQQNSFKRNLFFSGESHAGHFIPTIMDHILEQNDEVVSSKQDDGRVLIPLAGAAIGNGWSHPYYQYAAAGAAYGMGIIDLAQWEDLNIKEKQCQKELEKGNLRVDICFKLLDGIIDDSNGNAKTIKMSPYDNRVWEKTGRDRDFPPGHRDIEHYLGSFPANRLNKPAFSMDTDISKKVLSAIHANEATEAGQYYRECTDPPYLALAKQDGQDVIPELIRILKHPSKIQVLFFNGINDLMCNHVGNERFLNNLPWKNVNKFSTAKRYAWSPPLSSTSANIPPPAGYAKAYDNLIFLKIKDSGHMVPLDQPEIAFQMMKALINNPKAFTTEAEQVKLNMQLPGDIGLCDVCPVCSKQQCPTCPTKQCPSCEECPSCPSDNIVSSSKTIVKKVQSTTKQPENQNQGLAIGALMGGCIAIVLIGCVVFWSRSRRYREVSSTSDVEFSTVSEYRDEP